MSEDKNVRVKVQGKFDGMLQGLADIQREVARVFGGPRSKHRASQRPLHVRKSKRRRQGKVARRARRYNRRPTERPKGRRKP